MAGTVYPYLSVSFPFMHCILHLKLKRAGAKFLLMDRATEFKLSVYMCSIID